jgi:hypothetical protein
MNKPAFARKWGLGISTVAGWAKRDYNKLTTTAHDSRFVPEYGCRMLKAHLDESVLRVKCQIMREILLYRRRPHRERLSKMFGFSTTIVSMALKELKQDGILIDQYNPDPNLEVFKEDHDEFENYEGSPTRCARPHDLLENDKT